MRLFIAILFLAACAPKSQETQTQATAIPEDGPEMVALDGRPPVLVIGDSISQGYMPFLQTAHPELQFVHGRNNNRSSTYGATYIQNWVNHSPTWPLCTINHGAWDALADVSIDVFKANIAYEITVLNTRCARVQVVTATHASAAGNRPWLNDRIEEYNTYLRSLGACDVSNVTSDYADEFHFNPGGYRALANKLNECLYGSN